MKLIDVVTFVKLMVDYVIYEDIKLAVDPMTLIDNHPLNPETNDIYWYNPQYLETEVNYKPPEADLVALAEEEDQFALEFALTEIFNYYARTYPEKTLDFE